MAKAFFRFLRGELNGFYLTNIYDTLNKTTQDMKDFLADFKKTQFSLGEISEEDIYNLGRFAGIAFQRTSQEDSSLSVHMTNSHFKRNTQVSEQGLFEPEQEKFNFDYALTEGDINDNATKDLRSSLVGTETPEGYIAEGTENIFKPDGTVDRTKVLASPPTDKAYSEFYGDQFLVFSSGLYSVQQLPIELYMELFKAIQIIRYNGVSIESLCKIILVVCGEDLVKISRLETVDEAHNNIYYVLDENAETDYKQQRMSLLNYIIDLKFHQVKLVESLA